MAIVKVVCTNLANNPSCPHGPTLKFVRIKNGSLEKFFACSTFRDRKDCKFYVPEEDLVKLHQNIWALEKRRVLPRIDQFALRDRLREVQEASPKDRIYCHTCGQLDIVPRRGQHGGHSVQTVITDHMLSHPSEILKPKEGSKKEAQYLFAASTTQVIVDNLQRAGVSHVLCLGTPRVHEHIQAAAGDTDSLLLDLDHRHHSFWYADKFVWFNMFNRHMMTEDPKLGRRALKRFLTAARQVALVMDPPFGGHVEPLVATVRHFTKLVARLCQHSQLKVIWIFPYFRERHISEKCPMLKMLDYKVQYENHKEFNNGAKGRKLGSPVRLFTNMKPRQFVLPKAEGYRICKACDRWVSAENKHCAKCNSCPSKDGRTYVHCGLCKTCVKPQWQHCHICQSCLPPSHICSEKDDVDQQESEQPRHKKFKSSNQTTKATSTKFNRRKKKFSNKLL